MTSATINGQTVDLEIIESDGSSGASPRPTELELITALDAYLRSRPAFADAYPGAHLTRVDSNRILQDTDEGRFYLRYRHQAGDTEFWGHRSETSALDVERGIVSVGPDRLALPG